MWASNPSKATRLSTTAGSTAPEKMLTFAVQSFARKLYGQGTGLAAGFEAEMLCRHIPGRMPMIAVDHRGVKVTAGTTAQQTEILISTWLACLPLITMVTRDQKAALKIQHLPLNMRISCMTDHNSRQAAILQTHTYSAKIQNKVKPPTEQLSSELPLLAQAKLALKGRLPVCSTP